ncbi:hypothetical protein AgCh_015558 [Apium graveolens]
MLKEMIQNELEIKHFFEENVYRSSRVDTPYIGGLAPILEDQELSGPYTKRDSESSDDDVAPRRRRADLDGPIPRRAAVPRADPSDLLPLGDPDDLTPPFTEEIIYAHISRKFKIPTIKAYHGTGDPANYFRTFFNALLLQPVNDAIKDLSKPFIKQCISGKVHEKSSTSLMSIVHGAKESLRDYLNRFTKEVLKVPGHDVKLAMIALQQGTRDEFFKMLIQILMEIERDRDVCWPKPLKDDPTNLDKSKYCRFHKNAGHDTDECRQLKDEIEFLIQKGRLSNYTGDGGDRCNNGRRNLDDRKRDQDDQG